MGNETSDTAVSGKGARTRSAILAAAIDRFGRDGYRGTTVADIARDAGVGGTITYTYFPNKEALFRAALDEDAAAVITEGVSDIFADVDSTAWRHTLIFTLLEALDRHPLARRVLSGLEPHVTAQMMDLPALAELRKALTEKLRDEQISGLVRDDIDPAAIGNGAVAIVISLLMAVLQFGREAAVDYSSDVLAVFEAAIERPGGVRGHA